MPEIRPLITESSTSESTTVEVVMNDLRDNLVRIPDYQRDSDQWSAETKSLLVESVINNLSIPAFFFEVILESDVEKNEVIDGQQRLTTLFDFFENRLRLVDSQDAPYLSPASIHYAGKKFEQLPEPYRQAFKRFRLSVIKLRNLGEMRLEIFRRINQGGTPLSGQDIRLAYYGEKSPSLAFIRLSGIYDPERLAAKRFLNNAAAAHGLSFPWTDRFGLEAWNDWWNDKEIAHGQTASETFLWSLVVAQVQALDAIVQNRSALQTLRTHFNRGIDEALDVYCAQLRWQDANSNSPAAVFSFPEMREKYFPFFQDMIKHLLGQKGPSLPVNKHRAVASVIGAAYRAKTNPKMLSEQQWTDLVELVRHPAEMSKRLGFDWPQSKGRWDGPKGYRAQMEAAQNVVAKIVNGR
jgi:Protein of unknown function DUF262